MRRRSCGGGDVGSPGACAAAASASWRCRASSASAAWSCSRSIDRQLLAQPDDVGVLLGELRFRLRQLLLRISSIFFRRSMPSGETSLAPDVARATTLRVAQPVEQLVALLDDADLLLAVQPELGVQPLEGGEVDADLLRQLRRCSGW